MRKRHNGIKGGKRMLPTDCTVFPQASQLGCCQGKSIPYAAFGTREPGTAWKAGIQKPAGPVSHLYHTGSGRRGEQLQR